MPFTTVQKKIKGAYWLDDIFCSAISPALLAAAEEEITALLRERHHVMPSQEDDFNLRHPADIGRARAAASDYAPIGADSRPPKGHPAFDDDIPF